MNKPKILYHGSAKKDIEEFEPRVSQGSGESNGPAVYATDDIAVASIFLADIRATWGAGRFGDVWYVMIPETRKQFLSHDTGGCIYELPSNTFETGTIGGFGENEWASPVPVHPIKKQCFDSGLDALLSFGVQAFFMTPEEYQRIQASDDHGLQILRGIQSENQNRGVNIRQF